MSGRRGHRALPHTADVRIEAWAPTREECLAEAVAALVAGFADVTGVPAGRTVEVELAAEGDEDALLAVLDEVIYLLDTEDVVPVDAEVADAAAGPRLRLAVAALADVPLTGAVPKAVSLHELRIGPDERGWSCAATIDV